MPTPLDRDRLHSRLSELASRHHVPGAQLGILRMSADGGGSDDTVVVAHGVLGTGTGVPTTEESLFQIGSITKVWTATVVMQLVDDGVLELDAPVADVLPELRLADPDVTRAVTIRHLLTHTSGIDGDVFTDTGRGDDCIAAYVGQLHVTPQNHPLGASWSYCNAGYVVLGRVIERVTAGTWDAALRDRLSGPLGLHHTVTLPEEALLFRTAIGHLGDPPDAVRQAPAWGMPRSLGPAGLVVSNAHDVLAFARMHLDHGRAADGSQILSRHAVEDMAASHAELPDPYVLGDSWGLGWIRFDWGGHRLLGHDGATLGQAAFLRLLPELGLAVILLTNGGAARDLYEDLFREIFADIAGVAMRAPFAPPPVPPRVDVTPHLGTYERSSVRIDVITADGHHRLRTTLTGSLAELTSDDHVEEHQLVAVGDALFAVKPPGSQYWVPVVFETLAADGRDYLHMGARATPRVSR